MDILFALLIGHAAADFALQPEAMARGKNRNRPNDSAGFPPWPYWLASHALIHGGAVFAVTGSVWLALAETAAHALIDFGKCENKYGIHTDQALHVACKLVWWSVA